MASPIMNRVDTIFIHVRNLNDSIQWYSKLLGVEVPPKDYIGPIFTFPMGEGRPGLTLDNHCFDQDYHFTPSTHPLFNLSAHDIDAAFQHVKGIGAKITSSIQVYPDLSEFTFMDPDGNQIMICSCITE
ncbi:VOC family protein [Paenibacillus sp. 1011MAR3C5]|uniref:VOC family protein n=1 Tax=Paenibacillus sp. 1011MAR3C5 TaxID=1675787 RepID=UPI000E6C2708|nr:VOC family protein [Paenibacillus sp. 1011MAR3C5]RJE90293.1 VOC family protein [Paenibacillus sp. 1011MAR3C5]